MQQVLNKSTENKIKSLQEIGEILEKDKGNGLTVIQCHGVFDLLHPGHIRHFKAAKSKGDRLIVSITPDRFVNKGPGRPAFPESLRLEAIAALEDVDYVVLNDSPDAISAIQKIKPSFYVKGNEYSDHEKDVTGKIAEEARAVEAVGGQIYYTNDIVFSSSSLLNKYFESTSPEAVKFVDQLKIQYSADEIIKKIDELNNLKVLIIGDAIIDEYQFAVPLGQTGKGQHLVVRCTDKEIFLGGSLIIANHVAQFSKNVTLLTAVGQNCPFLNFIQQNLDPHIKAELVYLEEMTTLVKKRYVLRDGSVLSKLFETYAGQEEHLNQRQAQNVIDFIHKNGSQYDLILVCDFGNGFTNPGMIDAITDIPAFLALNTQTNSGNRGFNVVTNYRRADYISLNEPELRLSAQDKTSSLEGIAADICQIMGAKNLSVTQGVKGVLCYASNGDAIQIPAFATTSIDRIGAGDSFLSLSSLCMAKGYSHTLAAFIGSVAAAMSVQMIGNQEAIKKAPLCKFITRLLK